MVVLVIGGSVRWSGKSRNSTAVLHLDGHLALHRQRGAKFHHLRGRYPGGIDLPAIRLSAQFRHFTDGEGAPFNRGLSRDLWPGHEVLSFGGLAAQPARTDIDLRRGESDHACLARLAAAHAMET